MICYFARQLILPRPDYFIDSLYLLARCLRASCAHSPNFLFLAKVAHIFLSRSSLHAI